MQDSRFCRHCGQKVSINSSYCSNCGKEAALVEVNKPAAGVTSQPRSQPPDTKQPSPQPGLAATQEMPDKLPSFFWFVFHQFRRHILWTFFLFVAVAILLNLNQGVDWTNAIVDSAGLLIAVVIIDALINYTRAWLVLRRHRGIKQSQKILHDAVPGEGLVGYTSNVYIGSRFGTPSGMLIFTTSRMIFVGVSEHKTQVAAAGVPQKEIIDVLSLGEIVDTLSHTEIIDDVPYESIIRIHIKVPLGKLGRGSVTYTTANEDQKVIWFAPRAGGRKDDWSFLNSPPSGLSAKLVES